MTARVVLLVGLGLLLTVPASFFAQAVDGDCEIEKLACATSRALPPDARPVPFVVLGAPVDLTGLAPGPSTHGGNTIPCTDTSAPTVGCPDMQSDVNTMQPFVQTITFSATSCAVQEGSTVAGTRKLLRFTSTWPNFGDGDLIVGAPSQHPEWFVYSGCHNHYHFREYADYRLWTFLGYLQWNLYRTLFPEMTPQEVLNAHPELFLQLVTSNKQGFCVIDLIQYEPMPGHYFSCGNNQGISVGWADEYYWGLTGQWVDITSVAPGSYVLEEEVNAERLIDESDYTNNRAAVNVQI